MGNKKGPENGTFLATPGSAVKSWCGQEDSNLHGSPRYHLKVVRLPIPPWPRNFRIRVVFPDEAVALPDRLGRRKPIRRRLGEDPRTDLPGDGESAVEQRGSDASGIYDITGCAVPKMLTLGA